MTGCSHTDEVEQLRKQQQEQTTAHRESLIAMRAEVDAIKATGAKAMEAIEGMTELVAAFEDALRRMGRQIGLNAQNLQAGLAALRKALAILQRKIRGY